MLKYRIIRPVIFSLLIILLICRWVMGWDTIYLLVPLLAIYLAFISWGAYFIHSGFFLNAICRLSSTRKEIAITFDDGPDRKVTPAVLDMLKSHHAKASFFCIGKNLEGNEDIISRIVAEGHTLGNHSWSHGFFFDFYRDWRVEAELIRTSEALKKLSGREVKLFRPPFGVTNPVIARVVKKLKMPVIGWSIRSMDTTIRDPAHLFKRVAGSLKPGDIVLFHDSHPRILPVLEKFLDHAVKNGYDMVSLEDILSKEKKN